ncbi:MAG: hypothetical protein EOP28_06200 [Rhodococcus sp. (in: high G+C Gram-positive bacteria)]|nr:MAG: hypothetical protein EOP28_06200 [Rhodococcus sp. (in: high G+C Gram-positive bacteria)]
MIDNDDLLHRVDQHYLGPTGFTLPVRIRYAALGLGAAFMVTSGFGTRRSDSGPHSWSPSSSSPAPSCTCRWGSSPSS